MEEIDRKHTENIVCPYCGYISTDSWDYSNDSDDIECDECGETFFYEREYDITYSTIKTPCEEKENKECSFVLRKDYPYHISKQNCDIVNREVKWTDRPEKEWTYNRMMECEDCDETESQEITKEEYDEEYGNRVSQFKSPSVY